MREFASSLLVTVANETLYQLSYDPIQFILNKQLPIAAAFLHQSISPPNLFIGNVPDSTTS